MSVAVLERSPISCRWAALRFCSGDSSGPTSSISAGTPSRTTSPSVTEVCSRITATRTNETIAPLKRAVTSMTWPRWEMSLLPIATTSPVETLRESVPPRWTACRPVSWMVR